MKKMIGHLGINVSSLELARGYWSILMPMLGFEVFRDDADQLAYMPADGRNGTYVFLYGASDVRPHSGQAVGLQHLAFMVPSRQTVRDVNRVALELGSVAVHQPQTFPQYPPPYFAAFWRDLDGIMIEAVCHRDR